MEKQCYAMQFVKAGSVCGAPAVWGRGVCTVGVWVLHVRGESLCPLCLGPVVLHVPTLLLPVSACGSETPMQLLTETPCGNCFN